MKWISVKNKKPDYDVEVLVFLKSCFTSLDCQYLALFTHDELWEETLENEILKNVTHWMPLPKPPEDK